MDDDILEKLSALEYEQWCEWAGAVSKDLYALLSIMKNWMMHLSGNCLTNGCFTI